MGLQERTKARQRRAFAMTERMPGQAMPSRRQRRQPYGLPPESVEKSENLSSTGRKGNPGRVSCTMMIPIFQNFFEVLKNASACRKDFFDTLRRQPYGLPPSYSVRKWNHSAFSTASVR